jgi:hypothetical protein
MKKETRNYIAAACLGIVLMSFASFGWLFFQYQSSRPRQQQLEVGRVHPLRNGRAAVYLTDIEATGLALLAGAAIAGFVLTVLIVPKGNYMIGRKIPTGLDNPTGRQYSAVLIAGACELTIIAIWGHQIVAWAVSNGISFFWE